MTRMIPRPSISGTIDHRTHLSGRIDLRPVLSIACAAAAFAVSAGHAAADRPDMVQLLDQYHKPNPIRATDQVHPRMLESDVNVFRVKPPTASPKFAPSPKFAASPKVPTTSDSDATASSEIRLPPLTTRNSAAGAVTLAAPQTALPALRTSPAEAFDLNRAVDLRRSGSVRSRSVGHGLVDPTPVPHVTAAPTIDATMHPTPIRHTQLAPSSSGPVYVGSVHGGSPGGCDAGCDSACGCHTPRRKCGLKRCLSNLCKSDQCGCGETYTCVPRTPVNLPNSTMLQYFNSDPCHTQVWDGYHRDCCPLYERCKCGQGGCDSCDGCH